MKQFFKNILQSLKLSKMDTPKRAGDMPVAVELEKGSIYAWCACGLSTNQPYCDGTHTNGTDIYPEVFEAERTGQHYLCMCKATKNKPFCDGSHAG
jgi:CDGSH-type Zn-finger protein